VSPAWAQAIVFAHTILQYWRCLGSSGTGRRGVGPEARTLASLSWCNPALLQRGVPTPSDAGCWQAVQVQWVLDRGGELAWPGRVPIR
jgi:hypothetical protein